MSAGVAVTGIGVIGAFGAGRDALLAGWQAGEPRLSEVDRSAGYHRHAGGKGPGVARLAALADTGAMATLVPPAQARRMSPPARMAVAAMRLALRDAAFPEEFDHTATGIVTGTAFGPAWVTEQLLRQILAQGPDQASPALFTESVASASAAQMALAIRARGPNQTLTQREASDLLALGEAARWIVEGRAHCVLVGIVEEGVPILHALLDRFRALARADAYGPERARPFDRHRNGLTAAEGATVVVLESAASAAGRGARTLCRLVAHGAAFDPSAPSNYWGRGEAGLSRALGRFLIRSGSSPAGIDRIVSGASGSRLGDRLEARTLRGAWGALPLPPILAPKSVLGEYAGGSLAAGLLVAGGHRPGATTGFTEIDPELGVAPVVSEVVGELAPPRLTLLSALASGGAAAWTLVAAPLPSPAPAPGPASGGLAADGATEPASRPAV